MVLRAAAVSWLPALAPIVTGMLRDCGQCLQAYLLSLPLVPGILAPVLLGLDDTLFFVAGGAATLALFGGLTVALRELPRALGLALQATVVLGVAFAAIGYANALRA